MKMFLSSFVLKVYIFYLITLFELYTTCQGRTTWTTYFQNVKVTKEYIDKTGFIEKFLTLPSKYVYITAPPQFGKTMTIKMLGEFCNGQVTKNGTVLEANATDVYKVFARTTILQKRRSFFDAHVHKYTVIYLDFWRLQYTRNYKTFQNGFCFSLCRTIPRFKFLQNVETKFYWAAHVSERSCRDYCINNFHVSLDILRDLAEELHKMLGKPIVLFVDEFDAVLHGIMRNNFPELPHVLIDLEEFLGKLLKCGYVNRALFFGSVYLGGTLSAISENVEHINFNDGLWIAQYFGLSKHDVEVVLGKFGRSDGLADVTFWYGGFTVKEEPDFVLFRPYPVRQFAVHGKLDNYWPRISPRLSPHFYTYFDDNAIRSHIKQVLSGDSPLFNFSCHGLSVKKVEGMNKRIMAATREEKHECLDKGEVDIFMQYLTESGLFSISSQHGVLESVRLRPTNHETRLEVEYYLSPNMSHDLFGATPLPWEMGK